ncbi:MAG: cell wall-binding repeat-containing protein [Peptostreptococcus sp.]|uniref:cell wall-binding repeat-containing protein n=1 Tax=Peptostreptococcus sp. TaxID=1262 RepID=UPI002FC7590C
MNKKHMFLSLIIITFLSVFCISDVHADNNINLIKGNNRIETSIESSHLVDSDTIVVANAYNYADSLSAYNIASKYKARLILVSNETDLSKELNDRPAKKAFLIGGNKTLNGKAVNTIYKNVSSVKRIDGKNRYQTNEKSLKEAKYRKVGVADGRNYPDALSSFGLLKSENLGLKLVDGSIPYTSNRQVVYTFGGKQSVLQDGGLRIAGSNRYQTSELINNELCNIDRVAITTGENYADALSSINVINSKDKSSIVLVHNISSSQEKYLENINEKYIIGGMIPDASLKKIYKSNSDLTSELTDRSITPFDISEVANPFGLSIDLDDVDGSIDTPNPLFGQNVFETQGQYNQYLYNSLRNGFNSEKETVIVSNNVVINNSFSHIANGMGFSLKQSYQTASGGYKKINIDFSIRQKFYTREVYNKDEYVKNMNEVENLIKKSGVLSLASNRDKAKQFAKYLQFEFPYNSDLNNHLKSRSPYSIAKYHTAVCEGSTYAFNQAMFLLRIPSYSVSGMSDRTLHMEAEVYYDGKWNSINPTGFEKSGKEYFNSIYEMDDENIETMMTSIASSSDTQNLIQRELASFYKF